MLHIYIDGSARNNGRDNSKGGFGIVIFDDDRRMSKWYIQEEYTED